jgi:hypothetical protein
MSTDPRAANAARRFQRQARGFRRTVLATVGILSLAAAALSVAGAFRAPRLDTASVAAATALVRPDQRLVLQTDQAIRPLTAADLTITPEMPFEFEATDRTITVRFTGMLRALTDYTVTVAVTGASTGAAGTLTYEFTTPDLVVSVLQRDLDGPDRVVRRPVSSSDTEVVLESDRIQEFAETGYGVAAIVLDDDSSGRLVIAPDGEDQLQDVALPGVGILGKLHTSDTSGLLGFTFIPEQPEASDPELLLFDPTDPSGSTRAVTGLDGQPVAVLDWLFVPGTAYLVVQAFDQSLLLVDTATDAAPVPLGEHAELRGFIPGTVQLVVANPLSGSTIDLSTGDTVALDLPDDGADEAAYRGKLLTLSDERYLEIVYRTAPGGSFRLDYELLAVGPEGAEVLYDPEAGNAIRDICLSPNAQYVAVEVSDPEGVPDEYPVLGSRTGTTTYFIDLEAGASNRSVRGIAPSWCA